MSWPTILFGLATVVHGQITHVTESQLGTTLEISADGKSILYKQEDGFSPGRWDSFRYVVDGSYEANVSLVLHRPVQDNFFEIDENSLSLSLQRYDERYLP